MPKLLKNPYVLVAIGVLCFVLAFRSTTDTVLCDGTPMLPSDTCGTLTYAEKVRGGKIMLWGLLGLGAVLLAGGVRSIARRRKGKKK